MSFSSCSTVAAASLSSSPSSVACESTALGMYRHSNSNKASSAFGIATEQFNVVIFSAVDLPMFGCEYIPVLSAMHTVYWKLFKPMQPTTLNIALSLTFELTHNNASQLITKSINSKRVFLFFCQDSVKTESLFTKTRRTHKQVKSSLTIYGMST